MSKPILVVDNYDSFVYTIVSYLRELGAECLIYANDNIDVDLVEEDRVAGVLISPGPGTPSHAGGSLDLMGRCATRATPVLGVCLGHQALAELYGGRVVPARQIVHGHASTVHHDAVGIFAGVPGPFAATRYHSLVVDPDSVPPELLVTAWTSDNVIMGLAHRSLPLVGVQFHPESVLSQHGHRMLANWLAQCGQIEAMRRFQGLSPRLRLGEGAPADVPS